MTSEIKDTLRQYLLKQCQANKPATYQAFKADNPETHITQRQYIYRLETLKPEFEKDPQKATWFHSGRTRRDGLTHEERVKYFGKGVRVDSARDDVRKYLNEQCSKTLPATYLDFKAKNPKTKIDNARPFWKLCRASKTRIHGNPGEKAMV